MEISYPFIKGMRRHELVEIAVQYITLNSTLHSASAKHISLCITFLVTVVKTSQYFELQHQIPG